MHFLDQIAPAIGLVLGGLGAGAVFLLGEAIAWGLGI